MKTFDISILAADRTFYEGPCNYLNIPTPIGLYGIMADHRNTISSITPGILTLKYGKEEIEAIVSTGLFKIEDGQVLVLVDSCERPDEIDQRRALRAKKEAERKLKQKMSHQEYEIAQANLSRAMNRLKNSRKKDKTI